ncbi:MAG: hypothetical protein J5495_05095 [Bacteroidales bacterium]|nr:hypothetical protein [Bacteroidales bacterium]
MNKWVLLFAFLVCGTLTVSAQDIITKKDGTDIQAKVLEVTDVYVKYKKFSNPEGPVYSVHKSDILLVRYENGESEVFNYTQMPTVLNTDMPITPNMKYRDLKNLYDTQFYTRQAIDRYSPFWIGFAEFFIPGLGEAITGEWGRAAAFFFSNMGLSILAQGQVSQDSYGNYNYSNAYWPLVIARVGLNIWSICDAVHVAKVKNMYYQDLFYQRGASLDLKLEPFFTYTPTGVSNDLIPTAGLSLKLNF